MSTPKKARLCARDELRLILQGILFELLRVSTANIVNLKPRRASKPVQRLVGAVFQDGQGRTIKVVAKDGEVADRYIVQRSDGRCFHLYKSTIKRYTEDV